MVPGEQLRLDSSCVAGTGTHEERPREAIGEGLASGAVGKSGYQSNDYHEKMIKDRSRHLIEMTGLRDKMCVS